MVAEGRPRRDATDSRSVHVRSHRTYCTCAHEALSNMLEAAYIALSGIGPKIEGLKWESDQLLRIGRQASLEVVLRDTSVKRLHAEVKFQGQRWMLKNLAGNSFYPTFLNGRKIGERSHSLKLNDLIQVGQLKVRVSAIGLKMMERTSEPTAALPVPNINSAPPRARPKIKQPPTTTITMAAGITQPGVLVMTGIKNAPLRDPDG